MLSFILHNRRVWSDWRRPGADRVILVDAHRIAETLVSYTYFLNVLGERLDARIVSFGSTKPRLPWRHLYRSFNVVDHLAVPDWTLHVDEARQLAAEIRPRIHGKWDLLNLEIRGVRIGTPIYETYLKGGRPTVHFDDPRFVEYLVEGIGLFLSWEAFFRDHDVAALVVSHDCYLHPGLACEVAHVHDVPVYLPNVRGITRMAGPHSIHSYFARYREMFDALPTPEQARGIEWARERLSRRLKGEPGVDMPYATTSAFHSRENGRVLRQSDKTKVLICTHCFYDNPHAYGGLLFPDFYEWLCFLKDIASRTCYDWYLKVHPDPLPGTLDAVEEIMAGSEITILSSDVSHHQLVEEGIDVVFTAYGSVGHEYPALGVPVVNAGYNPHAAYDFNITPKSKNEYEDTLLNLDEICSRIELRDLYEFYYMHHDYVLADDLIFPSYRQFVGDLSPHERQSAAAFDYFLERWTPSKHHQIIRTIEDYLDSGGRFLFKFGPV